jgi:hypothetical protein
VPAGSVTVSFSALSTAVAANTSATIKASATGQTTNVPSTTVTIDAPTILFAVFIPSSINGGGATTLYVLLSGPAPAGSSLQVSSSSTRLTVGSSLPMVAGSVTQAFILSTTTGPAVSVQLTATYNGSSAVAPLSITP